MSLAAHDSEFRRWSGGVHRRIRQTFAASPAEPGELPLGFSAETGEARLASARDAVSRHVSGPHLGDQEYAVALTGNYSADQFLGTAVALHLCRIDQRHPKRNARS
jgi:hypothetical protein